MGNRNPTYYELLGVKPGAKHTDIHLAYNRKVRATQREDTVPDLKYESKLHEAFAVLSDLEKREAYDRQLAGDRLKPAFGAKGAVFAAVVVAAIAGGIYYYTVHKPAQEAARAPGKSREEIVAAATTALGRLKAMDMGGQVKEATCHPPYPWRRRESGRLVSGAAREGTAPATPRTSSPSFIETGPGVWAAPVRGAARHSTLGVMDRRRNGRNGYAPISAARSHAAGSENARPPSACERKKPSCLALAPRMCCAATHAGFTRADSIAENTVDVHVTPTLCGRTRKVAAAQH